MVDKGKCKTINNSKRFCYVCEKYLRILPAHGRNIRHKRKTAYKYYFGYKAATNLLRTHLLQRIQTCYCAKYYLLAILRISSLVRKVSFFKP